MGVSYKIGDKDTRPWGDWECIGVGDNFIVKKIRVLPKAMLSLQSHEFRSEHWVIVEGLATVVLGEETFDKKANESVFVPVKTKHRMINNTDEDVVFIEVQYGEKLDENDITRYEDIYSR